MKDHAQLAADFAAHGAWATGFEIDGQTYGNPGFVPRGEMERQALATFAPRTVLELGSLECGRTRWLAEGAQVTCVEGREANRERGRFVRDGFRFEASILPGNLEEDGTLDALGTFDLVYCVGVLYHLPEPWRLLRALAPVAPALWLWTHYTTDPDETHDGLRFRRVLEHGLGDPLSGLSASSLWPTRAALLAMLSRAGYAIEIVADDTHANGRALTAACRRRA